MACKRNDKIIKFTWDIGVTSCMFREEEAFLSSLPLLCLDKNCTRGSKRNVLTSSGVAIRLLPMKCRIKMGL